MNRPECWENLPYPVQEALLEQIDGLDYDHYESSRAEVINTLLNNPTWNRRNYDLVQAYYKGLTDVKLTTIAVNVLMGIENWVISINDLLGRQTFNNISSPKVLKA